MKKKLDALQLSATDINNYLSCRHLTELDLKVVAGELEKPEFNNPHAQVLQELGFAHEESYLEFLKSKYNNVIVISEEGSPAQQYQETIDAIKSGADVIAQAVLIQDEWFGRADFLIKTDQSGYEVRDTKLSRETKAAAILQLCLYSEMLEKITGTMPEYMYVVSPGAPFQEKQYRINDYASYYRLVRRRFIDALKEQPKHYPEPVLHCDLCKWFEKCNQQRRSDDHLSFVAGLTNDYRKEFEEAGCTTLKHLATTKPEIDSLNPAVIDRVHEQARLQFDARETGKPKFELLPLEEGRGFYRIPTPSPGDIFFDLEGDKFYQESGLEYLWGFSSFEDNTLSYHHKWAKNFQEEKECFEWFIAEVLERKKKYPNLKIFHYSPYEPSALKRLMGRYGVLESEIDHLLRTESFVDLYSITRQAIRAGIEKYSIKDLEQFYEYTRKAGLRDVGPAKRALEHALELGNFESLGSDTIEMVRAYNQDDTDSTFFLRNWLEDLRDPSLARPEEKSGEIQEELNEEIKRLNAIRDQLQAGISAIPEERSIDEQAKWLLGDLVGFYRREDKVSFWEKFRLKTLDAQELLEDKSGVSGLRFIGEVGGTEKCPIHRYSYIDQYVEIKNGTGLYKEGTLPDQKEEKFGDIENIDLDSRTVDIKKASKHKDFHPNAFWAWKHIPKKNKVERMLNFAEDVIQEGTQYSAAKDILFKANPRLKSKVDLNQADLVKRTQDFALALDNSYLAIQGPPGTGKSYTASRLILRLLKEGYRVGVTGLSHKVISNLMAKTAEACEKEGAAFSLYQKTEQENQDNPNVSCVKATDRIINSAEPFVLGATDFEWSKSDLRGAVDYLVIDEAGQFSLVGILSIAHATSNIILLGDPAQLQQPIQGSHPDGCEVSCLEYIMDTQKTLPSHKGVFLETTYRLHPKICAFNSELFYESKLYAIKENDCQVISGTSQFANKALAYVPCEHKGNSNSSIEEVEVVKKIVEELTNGANFYTVFKDGKEITEVITLDAIKIISPYNAQVNRLKQALPGLSIGTVDKFQGQEAPIVIYSVATSSPEDAPRGMEFLYSGNRLNVAVSRAECLFIMVSNQKIFEPNCKSPAQMKLANSFCLYAEYGERIEVKIIK